MCKRTIESDARADELNFELYQKKVDYSRKLGEFGKESILIRKLSEEINSHVKLIEEHKMHTKGF